TQPSLRDRARESRPEPRAPSPEPGEELRRPPGSVSTILDAVGNANRAEAAARHVQSGDRRKVGVDRRDPFQMTDLELRALACPAIQARDDRIARDAQCLTQGRSRDPPPIPV